MIKSSPHGEWVRVDFPYEAEMVCRVKAIPGRKAMHVKGEWYWLLPITPYTLTFLEQFVAPVPPEVMALFKPLLAIRKQGQQNREFAQVKDTVIEGYPFKTEPKAHQRTGMRLLIDNPVFAILDEMGTGKSKMVVDAASYLWLHKELEKVIVVCPNTVKGNWSDEQFGQIAIHSPDIVAVDVFRIDADKPRMSCWSRPDPNDHLNPLEWIIVNYEAVRLPRIKDMLISLAKGGKAMMVLDESRRIKTPGAIQTKACVEIGKHCKRRVTLTGTPMDNPLDLYSQFGFLNKHIIGMPSFVAYRNRYAEMGGYEIAPGRPVEVIGWQHLDELKEKIASYSRRVLKSQCLDLPDKVRTVRQVPMTTEQWSHYKALKEDMVTTISHAGADVKIATPIILTKLLRMAQVTSGFLPVLDEHGKTIGSHPLDTNPKLEALMDLLEETSGKVIVYAMFRAELEAVQERLTKAKLRHRVIHGDIVSQARDQAVADFQNQPDIRVICCQVVTGGMGITLTAASTVVYLSNSQSWEHRGQSEDRAHRQGQKKSVTYVDMLCITPKGGRTVDHSALESAMEKKSISETVMGDLERNI